jgi:hypothetical protein
MLKPGALSLNQERAFRTGFSHTGQRTLEKTELKGIYHDWHLWMAIRASQPATKISKKTAQFRIPHTHEIYAVLFLTHAKCERNS